MKATLKVQGMHCASCAMSIDERLEEIPGVTRAATSFRRGQVKVSFDDGAVGLDELEAAITEIGYTAHRS